MISSLEQARRRQRLNQHIREIVAMRRAVGRPEPHEQPGTPTDPPPPTAAAAA
jgi:hypothetical protein